jgi:hypothetical protein
MGGEMHGHIHSLASFGNRRSIENVAYLQFDTSRGEVFSFAET